MTQTYHGLTSSDEPDVFDINQQQKHILNQLIYFASINWKAHKDWYHKCCRSAMNKALSACFVEQLWKILKPPTYSIDYVQNICDNNIKKLDDIAPLAVQKVNWFHLDTDLFSKYLERHLDFGFLLVFNLYHICLTYLF